MDTANRKLETSFARAGLGLGLTTCTRSFARLGFAADFSRHCDIELRVFERKQQQDDTEDVGR
jgi:hypothetical protein